MRRLGTLCDWIRSHAFCRGLCMAVPLPIDVENFLKILSFVLKPKLQLCTDSLGQMLAGVERSDPEFCLLRCCLVLRRRKKATCEDSNRSVEGNVNRAVQVLHSKYHTTAIPMESYCSLHALDTHRPLADHESKGASVHTTAMQCNAVRRNPVSVQDRPQRCSPR